MHGQIRGGVGGIGFCHRNSRQDSSAGCCGAKRQHRGGEWGGSGSAAASERQRSLYGGLLKMVLQVPASSLGWCYLLSDTCHPGLDLGHGGTLAELPWVSIEPWGQ